MSLVFEIIIGTVAVANLIVTGVFNVVELIVEHRKKGARDDAVQQIVEINNVVKSISPPNSLTSDD